MSTTSPSRTWTPSPVRCASRSSSTSDAPHSVRDDPRGDGGLMFRTPFIVTDVSPRSLNPTAKSFAPLAPVQGGNALFAMPTSRPPLTVADNAVAAGGGPSMRREPQQTAVPADAMTWAAGVGQRGGQGTGRQNVVPAAHYPAGGAHSGSTAPTNAAPLDDAAVQREAEAFIRETWTPVCVARGFHMVMVLNLSPRTCEADLSRMFFPMGASKVALVDPKELPSVLAQNLQLGAGGRRRLGVVFFDRKDFAMVGVEKLDNFVPSGQHQPLVVRYCGPDAQATPLPGAAEPHAAGESLWMPPAVEREAIQQEMFRVFGRVQPTMSMVAVHGLDPALATWVLRNTVVPSGAVGCEQWPPQQTALAPVSCAQYAKYKSISAVAWYPTEDAARAAVQVLDGRVQLGQRQPIHLALLTPTNGATSCSSQSPRSLHVSGQASPSAPLFVARGQAGRQNLSSPLPPPVAKVEAVATTTAAVVPGVNSSLSQVNTSVKTVASGTSVYTDPANTSTEVLEVYDKVDKQFLAAHPDPKVHLVGVHNLLPNTTDAVLYKIFYPMGALDVAVCGTPVVLRGKARVSGVAFFSSKGMAEEAAKKINDFVPHGQSRPLVARYLDRDARDDSPDTADDHTPQNTSADRHSTLHDDLASDDLARSPDMVRAVLPLTPLTTITTAPAGMEQCGRSGAGNSAPPQGASTPRRPPVENLSSSMSVSELLVAIEQGLATRPLVPEFLTAAMTQLAKHTNSGEEEADRLGQLLVTALLEASHPVMLSTPISNTLYQLHENLSIPRRGKDAETDEERDNIAFVRGIARAMLSLLVDSRRPREARSVAAVVCAYLFEFCYLGSPFDFAMRNVHKYAKELNETKALLAREAGVPTTPDEQAKLTAWVPLMDCLKDLTSQWSNANKTLASQDPYADEFQHFLDQFYGIERRLDWSAPGRRTHLHSTSTPTQPLLGEARSPNSTDQLGSASTRRLPSSATHGESELVTPSARPTPRRVVAHMSPSSATRPLKSQPPTLQTSSNSVTVGNLAMGTPGVSGVGAEIPHVVLTPFSDRAQGVSTDISLESNYVASVQAVAAAALCAPPFSLNDSPWQYGRSDNSNCTVYVTKLPSHFTSSQVRRLLTHFGTVNKVRLCREDKESGNSGGTLAGLDLSADGGSKNPYHRLSFGFVEFAESRSAKAMIEYFRNQNQSPAAFAFLLAPPGVASVASYLTEPDTQLLKNTRTSKARSPIHDEHPLDAELRAMPATDGSAQSNMYLRVKPCQFGLLLPDEPIENYAEVCEDALAAATGHVVGTADVAAAPPDFLGLMAPSPAATAATVPVDSDRARVKSGYDLFTTPATGLAAPGQFGTSAYFQSPQWSMNAGEERQNQSSSLMEDGIDDVAVVWKEAMDEHWAVSPAIETDDE